MKHRIDSRIIDWLLEESDPSIRYRTLTELLGEDPDSAEVRESKRRIPVSKPVVSILSQMHPEGYWLQKNPRTGEVVGDGVLYGAFATTHYCLAYLAELGMRRDHPELARAADRYLGLQAADGDFMRHFSCLFAYNIRTFAMLGYRQDPRVQKTIDLMINTVRKDGGYLCDMHEGKTRKRTVKSCIRGSCKALLAFSDLPEYKEHPRCQAVKDYFLRRGGIYRMGDPSKTVNRDVTNTIFPIHYRAGLLDILYALSKLGCGRDPRLVNAWRVLETKKDRKGGVKLDWTPVQVPFEVGTRGKSNKWTTFYACLAWKAR
jgi:hypothetical protein